MWWTYYLIEHNCSGMTKIMRIKPIFLPNFLKILSFWKNLGKSAFFSTILSAICTRGKCSLVRPPPSVWALLSLVLNTSFLWWWRYGSVMAKQKKIVRVRLCDTKKCHVMYTVKNHEKKTDLFLQILSKRIFVILTKIFSFWEIWRKPPSLHQIVLWLLSVYVVLFSWHPLPQDHFPQPKYKRTITE